MASLPLTPIGQWATLLIRPQPSCPTCGMVFVRPVKSVEQHLVATRRPIRSINHKAGFATEVNYKAAFEAEVRRATARTAEMDAMRQALSDLIAVAWVHSDIRVSARGLAAIEKARTVLGELD